MALFIVSLDTTFCVEAGDAETAKETALELMSADAFDAREADENDAIRHDRKCRPWTRNGIGCPRISDRTCNEIIYATLDERGRLEQEREAMEAGDA